MFMIGQQRLAGPTDEFTGEAITPTMVLAIQRAVAASLVQAIRTAPSVFAQLYICNLCPLILENQNQEK